MDLGAYDRLATIERKVVTQDPDYGTEVVTWSPLPKVWVNAVPVLPSRSEAVKMGVATARDQCRIRIHPWRNDFDSSARITLHGRGGEADQVFQIIAGPVTVGRREAVEVMCERYSS